MSGETLEVDPPVLRTAGTAFNQAGAGLAGLSADAPLGEAAAAVAQLATAGACRQAQSAVAAATTVAADRVRTYAAGLNSAARQYELGDQAAAAAIEKSAIPGR